MIHDIKVIYEEIRKSIKIRLCYPVEIAFWLLFPILWVIPFLFQGQALVGGLESPAFRKLTGTEQYVPYVLIGAIVSTYVFSALHSIAASLQVESYWGTLELILSSPTKRIAILLGKAFSDSITSTFFALSQAFICIFFFGLTLSLGKILPILLVMILLIAGLYGMAIALAALTLQIKESRSMINTINNLFYLFSPVRYPVEINPIIKVISLAIPLTYALIVVRGIMLLDRSIIDLWRNVAILAGIDVILITCGCLTFYWVETRVRKTGVISHY